jgi:hypothetical protein
MKEKLNCLESGCGKSAKYIRKTQFAGEHPYCETHAKQQSDFMQDNPSYQIWIELKEDNNIKGEHIEEIKFGPGGERLL